MTYKRETLEKLLRIIDEITCDPNNEWFKNRLSNNFKTLLLSNESSAIDDIYEYCIKIILKDHAEKFYKDIKLIDIKENLIDDFIRMEKFRRDDNFEDFCLAAFQQFEAIVNRLCCEISIVSYLKLNKEIPAISRYNNTTKSMERRGNPTIGSLIFQKREPKQINDFMIAPISEWYFTHRFRAVLYYYYFNKILLTNSDLFDKIYDIGNFLYQGRNLNHRGSISSPYQQKIVDKLLPNQHKYYFRFLGFLEDFISSVNSNI